MVVAAEAEAETEPPKADRLLEMLPAVLARWNEDSTQLA
jgi:hypothetical protein